jgi:hypothetical protein
MFNPTFPPLLCSCEELRILLAGIAGIAGQQQKCMALYLDFEPVSYNS